jgi:hypothetical protein
METTVIEEFIRNVGRGQENVVDVCKEMLADGKHDRVTVALQNRVLQPEPPAAPAKRESPRRCHVFHDVGGFAAYLVKYKTANTVILADVANLAITATLDEKAANGFEVIQLKPAVHPLFAPWQDLLAKARSDDASDAADEPMTVGAFCEFVMTNRRAVVAPDARELVLTLSQVRASKKITIDRGKGMKSLNGVVIETLIQGASKDEHVELPDSLTLNVPLFVRTSPKQIEIDLLAVAGDTNVYMKAVSADVDTARVEAFEEMLAECRKIEGVIVGTGSPATMAWDYLK